MVIYTSLIIDGYEERHNAKHDPSKSRESTHQSKTVSQNPEVYGRAQNYIIFSPLAKEGYTRGVPSVQKEPVYAHSLSSVKNDRKDEGAATYDIRISKTLKETALSDGSSILDALAFVKDGRSEAITGKAPVKYSDPKDFKVFTKGFPSAMERSFKDEKNTAPNTSGQLEAKVEGGYHADNRTASCKLAPRPSTRKPLSSNACLTSLSPSLVCLPPSHSSSAQLCDSTARCRGLSSCLGLQAPPDCSTFSSDGSGFGSVIAAAVGLVCAGTVASCSMAAMMYSSTLHCSSPSCAGDLGCDYHGWQYDQLQMHLAQRVASLCGSTYLRTAISRHEAENNAADLEQEDECGQHTGKDSEEGSDLQASTSCEEESEDGEDTGIASNSLEVSTQTDPPYQRDGGKPSGKPPKKHLPQCKPKRGRGSRRSGCGLKHPTSGRGSHRKRGTSGQGTGRQGAAGKETSGEGNSQQSDPLSSGSEGYEESGDNGNGGSEGGGDDESDGGSGDKGNGDEGSGDEGSGDEGSGDEGSGDEGSGDDSGARDKKHKKKKKKRKNGKTKVACGDVQECTFPDQGSFEQSSPSLNHPKAAETKSQQDPLPLTDDFQPSCEQPDNTFPPDPGESIPSTNPLALTEDCELPPPHNGPIPDQTCSKSPLTENSKKNDPLACRHDHPSPGHFHNQLPESAPRSEQPGPPPSSPPPNGPPPNRPPPNSPLHNSKWPEPSASPEPNESDRTSLTPSLPEAKSLAKFPPDPGQPKQNLGRRNSLLSPEPPDRGRNKENSMSSSRPCCPGEQRSALSHSHHKPKKKYPSGSQGGTESVFIDSMSPSREERRDSPAHSIAQAGNMLGTGQAPSSSCSEDSVSGEERKVDCGGGGDSERENPYKQPEPSTEQDPYSEFPPDPGESTKNSASSPLCKLPPPCSQASGKFPPDPGQPKQNPGRRNFLLSLEPPDRGRNKLMSPSPPCFSGKQRSVLSHNHHKPRKKYPSGGQDSAESVLVDSTSPSQEERRDSPAHSIAQAGNVLGTGQFPSSKSGWSTCSGCGGKEGCSGVSDATPESGGNFPQGSTPVHQDSTPVQQGSTPIQQDSTPDQQGSTPVQQDSTPVQQGSTPVQHLCVPTVIQQHGPPADFIPVQPSCAVPLPPTLPPASQLVEPGKRRGRSGDKSGEGGSGREGGGGGGRGEGEEEGRREGGRGGGEGGGEEGGGGGGGSRDSEMNDGGGKNPIQEVEQNPCIPRPQRVYEEPEPSTEQGTFEVTIPLHPLLRKEVKLPAPVYQPLSIDGDQPSDNHPRPFMADYSGDKGSCSEDEDSSSQCYPEATHTQDSLPQSPPLSLNEASAEQGPLEVVTLHHHHHGVVMLPPPTHHPLSTEENQTPYHPSLFVAPYSVTIPQTLVLTPESTNDIDSDGSDTGYDNDDKGDSDDGHTDSDTAHLQDSLSEPLRLLSDVSMDAPGADLGCVSPHSSWHISKNIFCELLLIAFVLVFLCYIIFCLLY